MALTITSLGRGVLGGSVGTATDLVTAQSGKSVLVDNIIFVNVTGTNRQVTVSIYDSSAGASYVLAGNVAVNANSRWVLETITLDVGDKVVAYANAASAIEFVANGVIKDL
jgi:hypothetical protein